MLGPRSGSRKSWKAREYHNAPCCGHAVDSCTSEVPSFASRFKIDVVCVITESAAPVAVRLMLETSSYWAASEGVRCAVRARRLFRSYQPPVRSAVLYLSVRDKCRNFICLNLLLYCACVGHTLIYPFFCRPLFGQSAPASNGLVLSLSLDFPHSFSFGNLHHRSPRCHWRSCAPATYALTHQLTFPPHTRARRRRCLPQCHLPDRRCRGSR